MNKIISFIYILIVYQCVSMLYQKIEKQKYFCMAKCTYIERYIMQKSKL